MKTEGREFHNQAVDLWQVDVLHYQFQHRDLLLDALTHASYANENPEVSHDNERLEFLGDAILSAIISKELFGSTEYFPEGVMTRLRSLIVRSESLAGIARALHIADYMRFGQGELKSNGKYKRSNLEDALEALVGAIYLDGDWPAAEEFVLRHFASVIAEAKQGGLHYDYKSRLYETLQALEVNPDVHFQLVNESGPAHDKEFTIRVRYNERDYPPARAKSKKAAEQEAARLFLDIFQQIAEEGSDINT